MSYGLTVNADARRIPLGNGVVQTVVTSPPYWGIGEYKGVGDGGIGFEDTVDGWVDALVEVFQEIGRVLRPDGTVWLNIGDSYTSGGRGWRGEDKRVPGRASENRPGTPKGLKSKDLLGLPWRAAFALQADGWYLRSDVVWSKPNPYPESVKDRPARSHEYLFLLSKRQKYYYDIDAVKVPGKQVPGNPNPKPRNIWTVWEISTRPNPQAHFATFPERLVEPCIRAGSYRGDLVMDPFAGSGTTGVVAVREGRKFIGVDLSEVYCSMANRRVWDELRGS